MVSSSFPLFENIVYIAVGGIGISVEYSDKMFPPPENVLSNGSSYADDNYFQFVLSDDSFPFVIFLVHQHFVWFHHYLSYLIIFKVLIKKMDQSIQILEWNICTIYPTVSCLEKRFIFLTDLFLKLCRSLFKIIWTQFLGRIFSWVMNYINWKLLPKEYKTLT